jgi:hypothetical protein
MKREFAKTPRKRRFEASRTSSHAKNPIQSRVTLALAGSVSQRAKVVMVLVVLGTPAPCRDGA